jgi:micrococcal nuclease
MLPRKRRSPVAWKPPRLLALCAAVLATWVLDECRSALQYFSGAVVRVLDGDTLEVLSSGRAIRVRLHGIDCPERGQPFANRARQFTVGLAFQKSVTVRVIELDRYNRVVGVVTLPDGRILSHELLAAGLAWWYRDFAPGDPHLAKLETEARSTRRGLWSSADAVPPWHWRRKASRSRTR